MGLFVFYFPQVWFTLGFEGKDGGISDLDLLTKSVEDAGRTTLSSG